MLGGNKVKSSLGLSSPVGVAGKLELKSLGKKVDSSKSSEICKLIITGAKAESTKSLTMEKDTLEKQQILFFGTAEPEAGNMRNQIEGAIAMAGLSHSFDFDGKSDEDMIQNIGKAIRNKQTSGEPLTPQEKLLVKNLAHLLSIRPANVGESIDKGYSYKQGTYDKKGMYQRQGTRKTTTNPWGSYFRDALAYDNKLSVTAKGKKKGPKQKSITTLLLADTYKTSWSRNEKAESKTKRAASQLLLSRLSRVKVNVGDEANTRQSKSDRNEDINLNKLINSCIDPNNTLEQKEEICNEALMQLLDLVDPTKIKDLTEGIKFGSDTDKKKFTNIGELKAHFNGLELLFNTLSKTDGKIDFLDKLIKKYAENPKAYEKKTELLKFTIPEDYQSGDVTLTFGDRTTNTMTQANHEALQGVVVNLTNEATYEQSYQTINEVIGFAKNTVAFNEFKKMPPAKQKLELISKLNAAYKTSPGQIKINKDKQKIQTETTEFVAPKTPEKTTKTPEETTKTPKSLFGSKRNTPPPPTEINFQTIKATIANKGRKAAIAMMNANPTSFGTFMKGYLTEEQLTKIAKDVLTRIESVDSDKKPAWYKKGDTALTLINKKDFLDTLNKNDSAIVFFKQMVRSLQSEEKMGSWLLKREPGEKLSTKLTAELMSRLPEDETVKYEDGMQLQCCDEGEGKFYKLLKNGKIMKDLELNIDDLSGLTLKDPELLNAWLTELDGEFKLSTKLTEELLSRLPEDKRVEYKDGMQLECVEKVDHDGGQYNEFYLFTNGIRDQKLNYTPADLSGYYDDDDEASDEDNTEGSNSGSKSRPQFIGFGAPSIRSSVKSDSTVEKESQSNALIAEGKALLKRLESNSTGGGIKKQITDLKQLRDFVRKVEGQSETEGSKTNPKLTQAYTKASAQLSQLEGRLHGKVENILFSSESNTAVLNNVKGLLESLDTTNPIESNYIQLIQDRIMVEENIVKLGLTGEQTYSLSDGNLVIYFNQNIISKTELDDMCKNVEKIKQVLSSSNSDETIDGLDDIIKELGGYYFKLGLEEETCGQIGKLIKAADAKKQELSSTGTAEPGRTKSEEITRALNAGREEVIQFLNKIEDGETLKSVFALMLLNGIKLHNYMDKDGKSVKIEPGVSLQKKGDKFYLQNSDGPESQPYTIEILLGHPNLKLED
ncbi:MAG: hypothetical protein ACON35_01120 [Candidatus Marinamargulisbacteria bacterium]